MEWPEMASNRQLRPVKNQEKSIQISQTYSFLILFGPFRPEASETAADTAGFHVFTKVVTEQISTSRNDESTT